MPRDMTCALVQSQGIGTASIDVFGNAEDAQFFGNIARVHLQGLSDRLSRDESPAVELGSWLTDGLFGKVAGLWKAVIQMPSDHVARFEKYCSAEGRRDRGASLWFEDIVGNVATPDVLESEASERRRPAPPSSPAPARCPESCRSRTASSFRLWSLSVPSPSRAPRTTPPHHASSSSASPAPQGTAPHPRPHASSARRAAGSR